MNHARQGLLALAGGMAAIIAIGSLRADADPMQAALEQARQARLQRIAAAAEAYNREVESADSDLGRSYQAAIAHYRELGDDTRVKQLQLELGQLLTHDFEAPAPEQPSGPHAALIRSIGPVLQDRDRRRFSTEQTLGRSEYVLLYFSAGWCGPCRKFTPELVQFHRRHQESGNIQVVFVSRDRSEPELFNYMGQFDMPWYTVPYARIRTSGLVDRYEVRELPYLVAVDHRGTAVLSSYIGTRYVGPGYVLSELEKRLSSAR
jgi:thiol-disulfide isomerase/thioredoxin